VLGFCGLALAFSCLVRAYTHPSGDNCGDKECPMFDRFERTVHRTLHKLAKQRIRMVLQPGDYWVIDRAIIHDEDTPAVLLTCQMRGWVEPVWPKN
jgi:hypothetical protein